jgi:predicted deacetylase
MSSTHQRRLIVSFHDLTPETRQPCERFLQQMRRIGVVRISLLVVPRFHGARPVHQNEVFAAWLRRCQAEGHDICLHGYTHRATAIRGGPIQQGLARLYTNGDGEFFQLDRDQATDLLRQGLAVLDAAGLRPIGFTPPAWLISPAALGAVRASGLQYSTRLNHIDLLTADRTLAAPTIGFSSRSAWRRLASLIWTQSCSRLYRRRAIVRVAAHPIDLRYPHMEEALVRVVQQALPGRCACTYADLAHENIGQAKEQE